MAHTIKDCDPLLSRPEDKYDREYPNDVLDHSSEHCDKCVEPIAAKEETLIITKRIEPDRVEGQKQRGQRNRYDDKPHAAKGLVSQPDLVVDSLCRLAASVLVDHVQLVLFEFVEDIVKLDTCAHEDQSSDQVDELWHDEEKCVAEIAVVNAQFDSLEETNTAKGCNCNDHYNLEKLSD